MRVSWSAIEQKIQSDFPNIKSISVDDLSAWIDDPSRANPIIIDARSKTEFDISHLKDAVHAESVQEAIKIIGDNSCVVYCSVGYRSARLVDALGHVGMSGVVNLQGSIFGWLNSGRNVYKEEEITDQVHPFNNKWAQLLNSEYRND